MHQWTFGKKYGGSPIVRKILGASETESVYLKHMKDTRKRRGASMDRRTYRRHNRNLEQQECEGEEVSEDSIVNMAMECSEEGWKAPEAAWLDMEAAKDGEVYFVNVALWDNEEEMLPAGGGGGGGMCK
jgi:hypothetical protein